MSSSLEKIVQMNTVLTILCVIKIIIIDGLTPNLFPALDKRSYIANLFHF